MKIKVNKLGGNYNVCISYMDGRLQAYATTKSKAIRFLINHIKNDILTDRQIQNRLNEIMKNEKEKLKTQSKYAKSVLTRIQRRKS